MSVEGAAGSANFLKKLYSSIVYIKRKKKIKEAVDPTFDNCHISCSHSSSHGLRKNGVSIAKRMQVIYVYGPEQCAGDRIFDERYPENYMEHKYVRRLVQNFETTGSDKASK